MDAEQIRMRVVEKKGPSKGYKTMLMELIVRYGKVKAVGVKKPVSNRTQQWRESALFLMFAQLKEMGHKLESPYGFREAHIRKLVSRWETEGLSAATIQNRLSVARTFSEWIGKPGMVKASEHYVRDIERVRRHAAAVTDHSWSAAGIDVKAMIGMVSESDRYVGMQMQLMAAFGLRREEAVMFKPHRADHGDYIIVRDGTKGGRERSVQISNAGQRAVLNAAKEMVKKVDGHVGHPDRSLKQALRRFNYIMERHGVTRKNLGITSHGLRHQRLNDRFEEIAGIPSPVRQKASGEDAASGPVAIDPYKIDLARARVSEEAGHSRLSISSAYTGSTKTVKKPALDWSASGKANDWKRFHDLGVKQQRTSAEENEFQSLREALLPASSEKDAEASGCQQQQQQDVES